MDPSARLKIMSRRVHRFAIAVGAISGGITLLRWFVLTDPNWLPPTIAAYIRPGMLTPLHRLAGFLIELIPLTAALYNLVVLHRICIGYCRGEFFGPDSGGNYRKFGTGLLLLGIANGLYTTLTIAVFSLLDTPKRLVLAFGFSTADLYLMILGLAVIMLGTVMDEAYRIHEENTQIV